MGSKPVFAADQDAVDDNLVDSEYSVALEFRNGRLWASVRQVPILELMRLIGKEAGFEVSAYGNFDNRSVSVSYSDLPLREAVRRLLRNTNAVVTYRNATESDAETAIGKIFLLGVSSDADFPIHVDTFEPGLETSMRIDEVQAGDSDSRIAFIDRAEGFTDEITLENLAFSLQYDPDPEVRLKAISALGGIGGSTAVDLLESGLGDDDREVRKKVVQTLGGIDDERIPLLLGQVLMGDSSAEVRLVAVQSIARKEGDVARIFLEAATGDNSSEVSEAAIGLLK